MKKFSVWTLLTTLTLFSALSSPSTAVQYYFYNLGDYLGGGGEALSINDQGCVVGLDYSTNQAYLWTYPAGTVQDLGTLGGYISMAFAINNQNQVVGYSMTASELQGAFLWTQSGGMQPLQVLPNNYNPFPTSINNYGLVAGSSQSLTDGSTHAVVWNSPNNITDLGSGGFARSAKGINDSGQVVGYNVIDVGPSGSWQPFIWTSQGGLQILPTFDGNQGKALSINNKGQIVGESTLANGDIHAQVLQ